MQILIFLKIKQLSLSSEDGMIKMPSKHMIPTYTDFKKFTIAMDPNKLITPGLLEF